MKQFLEINRTLVGTLAVGVILLLLTTGKETVSSILEANHRHSRVVRASAEDFTKSLEILGRELQDRDSQDAVTDARTLVKRLDSHSFDAFLSPDPIPQTQEIRLLEGEVTILEEDLSTFVSTMENRSKGNVGGLCPTVAPQFLQHTVNVLATRMRTDLETGRYGRD
jgi:hypothetical protein